MKCGMICLSNAAQLPVLNGHNADQYFMNQASFHSTFPILVILQSLTKPNTSPPFFCFFSLPFCFTHSTPSKTKLSATASFHVTIFTQNYFICLRLLIFDDLLYIEIQGFANKDEQL